MVYIFRDAAAVAQWVRAFIPQASGMLGALIPTETDLNLKKNR